PEPWSPYIHPEGQPYFHREGTRSSISVVTEESMHRPEIRTKISSWIACIESVLAEMKAQISNLELFLQLEGDGCGYYLVDHTTRRLFWICDTGTEELGLPSVVSQTQLNIVLEEHYWIHLEYFPMHLAPAQFWNGYLDELVRLLVHGQLDQMTSGCSTFIYSAKQCAVFLDLLQTSQDHAASGQIICVAARLWFTIMRGRRLTFYGEEQCRLSRDQAVLHDPDTKHGWISDPLSRLTFNSSGKYLDHLNDVFTDHMVYLARWKSMLAGFLDDWKQEQQGPFVVFNNAFRLHVFFLLLNSRSDLAVASGSLFGGSFLLSTFLMHRYEPLQQMTADEAMDYLETIQSPTFKFQFVALVFALPHALNLWGLLVLLLNCVFMFARYFGSGPLVGLSVASLITILIFQWTTSADFNSACSRISSYLTRSELHVSKDVANV
ncbi:hypothetical protein B0H10DRAFT_2350268, partial [Mycena sp. CBHHK59/15]